MPLGGFPGFEEDLEPPPDGPGFNGHGRHESGHGGQAGEPWQEPLDLFAEHLAVAAEVDESCLPATILRFARAEAARLAVDPVGIAAAALAVCSGVISDDWEVRLKQHDPGASRRGSGSGSSTGPAARRPSSCARPSGRWTGSRAELRREYQAAYAEYQEQHAAWKKLPKKEREGQDEPKPPAEPRITTQDATIEAY